MNGFGLMCLITLSEPARLDARAVRQALGETAPRSDVAVETRVAEDGERGLVISIDRQDYAAVVLEGRLPQQVHDAALRAPVGWPGRSEALAGERAVIALAAEEPARGHGLARAQAVALTRLAAALAATLPARALVWLPTGVAVSTGRFARLPAEIQRERWPVEIWIGFRLLGTMAEGGERIGALSHGAARYFDREIEVVPFPTQDRSEPLRLALATAAHLMTHGSHLRDGQTLQAKNTRPARCSLHPGRDHLPRLGDLARVLHALDLDADFLGAGHDVGPLGAISTRRSS